MAISGSVMTDERVTWDEEFIIRRCYCQARFYRWQLCGDFGQSPEVVNDQSSVRYILRQFDGGVKAVQCVDMLEVDVWLEVLNMESDVLKMESELEMLW